MSTIDTATMFEAATRAKLRFDTPKGQLTVEDLWDLPLASANKANLDDIAKDLYRQLKADGDVVSFVEQSATPANAAVQLKFDLVKHVISARLTENRIKADEQTRKAKKQQLLSILERKENAALEELTPEQIREMIASM